MQHHIEALQQLEQFLNAEMNLAFERNLDANVKIALQLPIFQSISVIRQVLHECAQMEIGIYDFTDSFLMAEQLEKLRYEVHLLANKTVYFTDYYEIINALAYYEQVYEAADYRPSIPQALQQQLEIAIITILDLMNEPLNREQIIDSLKYIKENITYKVSFSQLITRILSIMADIQQLIDVSVEPYTYQELFYTLNKRKSIQYEQLRAKTLKLIEQGKQQIVLPDTFIQHLRKNL